MLISDSSCETALYVQHRGNNILWQILWIRWFPSHLYERFALCKLDRRHRMEEIILEPGQRRIERASIKSFLSPIVRESCHNTGIESTCTIQFVVRKLNKHQYQDLKTKQSFIIFLRWSWYEWFTVRLYGVNANINKNIHYFIPDVASSMIHLCSQIDWVFRINESYNWIECECIQSDLL